MNVYCYYSILFNVLERLYVQIIWMYIYLRQKFSLTVYSMIYSNNLNMR